MVTELHMGAILTKMIILKRETNHVWLQNVYGSDLNETGNFRNGKPIIHGYIILHGGRLNGNEHYKRKIYSFVLFRSKD